MYLVYLAGPIKGLTYGAATNWRDMATQWLDAMSGGQIKCLSPMRQEKELAKIDGPIDDAHEEYLLSSQRGITVCDRFDATRSNLILANVLGSKVPSIGTVIEIGWGDLARNPIVLAIEDEGNPHDHAMIRELCPLRVNTLRRACDVACKVLLS